MRVDWERFLTTHGIEYVPQKENCYVHCCFCGSADEGHHLGISLKGRGWRCFRNPTQHRGRSDVRLVCGLLRCTEERAKELLGHDAPVSLPSQDTFKETWRKQLGLTSSGSVPRGVSSLTLPREFKPLSGSSSPFSAVFWDYLEARGYTDEQAEWVAAKYRLHYCTRSKYAYRLIIPIYDASGKLMTWTGRAVNPDAGVRYMSLATDDSCAPPVNLLLGLPLLWKAEPATCLVLCEGPFDAIAISVLGHSFGVWGTCFFGVNVSEIQADLLYELERRFSKMKLLIDPDATLRILNLRQRLPRHCPSTALLPGLKDPGELVSRGKIGVDFVKALAA